MLYITFNDQRKTFFPQQEVNGFINLNVTSEIRISSIIICLSGVGVLQNNDKDNKHETYFDKVAYIFNSEGMDDVKKHMNVGKHSFPFKFVLPQNIPASFESPNGFVRYSVTAYMDKGDCGLQSAVAFFTVNDILDLNEIPKCRKPRTYWAQQDGRRLFCFKCRSISAVLNIPRRGFVSGEKILINAEINNLRSKPISYVKATLVQVIKYNHKTGHRKIKRIVAEVLRGSVMPYESQVWKEEPLHIPPVAASKLVHCSLMDIRYILYLQVCSPKMATGKTIKLLKVPVIIGTVPLRQQQQQQELEEDKGEPLLSGTSLPAPISEPCVFGPYSITDVYGQDGVQITFTPLYATYSVRRDRVLELDN